MLIRIGSNGFWQPRALPTRSLRETARLFNQINSQTIIEIGSGIHGRLAGDNILTWARRTRANRIIAVDLDETRIREVKEATSQYPNVEAIIAEGVRYLADFSSTIDLLYLVPIPRARCLALGERKPTEMPLLPRGTSSTAAR